jgi:hypothetical protein
MECQDFLLIMAYTECTEIRRVFVMLNIPHNYLSIRDLIDEYRLKEGEEARRIEKLLECTKYFIVNTSPDFQVERDNSITDQVILNVLSESASGLEAFCSIKAKLSEEEGDVLAFCKATILSRLELLQKNNDRIFKYYVLHDNVLKASLQKISAS